MQKKIIILGAGIYQVPLIRKARENGLYTIVCSIPGHYPGFRSADKIYYEDTTDKAKILDIAKKESISAILTTGTDSAVRTIGHVCQKLGLTGVSEQSAIWATDKYLMKQRFSSSGVRTPKSALSSDSRSSLNVLIDPEAEVSLRSTAPKV